MFKKETAIDNEWHRLIKQEEKFFSKRQEKKDSFINQKLADKVPEKLQKVLDSGFDKAFTLVFEKGTGVIEKTYKKEELEQNYKIQQYASDLKQDKRSLRAISNNAAQSGIKNLMLSGAMGVGMGAFGIGLPDIPVFTSMLLKSIYEIALRYGYHYDSEEEQRFILLLIQGAVSYGESIKAVNKQIDDFIRRKRFEEQAAMKQEIKKTSELLSKELLYMKFLQGIPIAGIIGGAYDAVYMKRITAYAQLKYHRRYLFDQKRKLKGQ